MNTGVQVVPGTGFRVSAIGSFTASNWLPTCRTNPDGDSNFEGYELWGAIVKQGNTPTGQVDDVRNAEWFEVGSRYPEDGLWATATSEGRLYLRIGEHKAQDGHGQYDYKVETKVAVPQCLSDDAPEPAHPADQPWSPPRPEPGHGMLPGATRSVTFTFSCPSESGTQFGVYGCNEVQDCEGNWSLQEPCRPPC
ncbi:hypothetical protein WMF04_39940 [Sorangium sp. So ce260]|uniref:hypothetical protein n=1 Tax=Sorangium sp. So ce260 TaxID=3133291 RepID=UPI003F62AF76